MAQNYIESGDVLDWTATADTKSGDMVAIGDMVGISLGDAKTDQIVAVRMKGVFEVAKATGAITIGSKVYLDATASKATATETGNKFMGYAWESVTSSAPLVRVVLAK